MRKRPSGIPTEFQVYDSDVAHGGDTAKYLDPEDYIKKRGGAFPEDLNDAFGSIKNA